MAACFVGGNFATAKLRAHAVWEGELGAVGFSFKAGNSGFEVCDFGFAFAQNGGATRVVEFHQNLIFLDHIAFFNHDFGYDAGIQALDYLLTAAGNDIAVATGNFFDRAVVSPNNEDNHQNKKQDDDNKLATVFFFLKGGVEVVDKVEIFGFDVVFAAHNRVSLLCLVDFNH